MKRLIAAALICVVATYCSADVIDAKRLSRYGVKVVKCPRYVANLRTGLVSSVLSETTVCTATRDLKRASRFVPISKFPLGGAIRRGTAFPAVVNAEGDVQTKPFVVQHLPAILSYTVRNANYRSIFKIQVINAATGRAVRSFFRARGEVDGEIVWNHRGRYYLKINAFGDDREEIQPVYNISMRFMDEPFPSAISRADLKDSGVKFSPCPRLLIDRVTGKAYELNKGFVCSNSTAEKFEDGGATVAQFSLGGGVFLAGELETASSGGTIWLPFRVNKPTAIEYSVEDPSNGKGGFTIELINLATGRIASRLVSVEGSIDLTQTFVNIPGDYYMVINTNPYKPDENGEISWEFSGELNY